MYRFILIGFSAELKLSKGNSFALFTPSAIVGQDVFGCVAVWVPWKYKIIFHKAAFKTWSSQHILGWFLYFLVDFFVGWLFSWLVGWLIQKAPTIYHLIPMRFDGSERNASDQPLIGI